MPLSARLDYRFGFSNQTPGELNFLSGQVRFFDSAGSLSSSAPLSPSEFAARSAFNSSAFINGISLVDLPELTFDRLTDLVTANDGRTWTVGSGRGGDGVSTVVLGRFRQDGRTDSSFDGQNGGNGIVVTPVKGATRGLVVDAGAGIFVSGGTVGGLANPFVARFDTNGVQVLAFGGGDGVATWSLGGFALAEDIARDDDGRVVVAGWASVNGTQKAFASRLTPNGVPDPSFGGAGNTILNVPGSTASQAFGIAADSIERVLVAGHTTVDGSRRMWVARLGDDGLPDEKFGSAGFSIIQFPGSTASHAAKLVLLNSGRILLAGRVVDLDGNDRFGVARLLDDGSLDPDFGTGGRVTFSFPGTEDSSPVGAIEDFFGRVILTGHATSGAGRAFAVARLKSDGTLDPTFSKDGRRTIPGLGGGSQATAVGAGILYAGDVGDIIVGGWAEVAVDDPIKTDPYRWAFARLDFNGSLNPGVTVPTNAVVRTDLLDFPFAGDAENPPFPGFDPKSAPARVDVVIQFKEIPGSVVFAGAQPKPFERNRNNFQFPLGNWVGPQPVLLRVSQSHHFGQNHVGNPSQRYALDIVMFDTATKSSRRPSAGLNLNQLRTKWSGAPGFDPQANYQAKDFNEASLIYGAPVSAIAAGQVVFSRDGDPENFPVGTRDPASGGGGNSVIINHGNGEFSFYAHMITGTVQVNLGDQVTAGQALGLVGNSGSSSGPHLHFHVMRTYPTPGHGPAVPMYFNNLQFASTSTGPQVRQLRAELPQGALFQVLTPPLGGTTPGSPAGPGKLGNLPTGSALQGAPVLIPPVQVTGSIGSADSGSVADAGDVAERIYAFAVPATGYVQVRLAVNPGDDVDFVVYDRNLAPRRPMAGKSRRRPEVAEYLLSPGTYFVLVSRDDALRSTSPSSYTLDVGFTPLPQISVGVDQPPGGGPGRLTMRFPIPIDPEGEPIALLLPAVQKIRNFAAAPQWEPIEVRPTILRGVASYEFDLRRDGEEFYRVVYPGIEE